MVVRRTRRRLLAALGAGSAALAGCADSAGNRSRSERTARSVAVDGTSTVAATSATSAEDGTETTEPTETKPGTDGSLPPVTDIELPRPFSLEKLRQDFIVYGGVPKDGIPAIDDPSFAGVGELDWLEDEAFVFGVVRNGDPKAYPRRILAQHEIVNDTVGGDPLSVTYCPLTGTALGFERGDTTFGVSGRLVNNNLIMYDRATQTWWPQVLATGIPGFGDASAGAGKTLKQVRVTWTTWGAWKERHPETTVLTQETGYLRDYSDDPYGQYRPYRDGYYEPDSPPMFEPIRPRPDGQYPVKSVFMGARTSEGALAVRKDALRDRRLITGTLGDTEHLAVYDPALDTGHLYANPDGLDFNWQNGQVAGPDATHHPTDLPLEPVSVPWFDAMWFAFFGFYPTATIID